jgi:hypothetical protein
MVMTSATIAGLTASTLTHTCTVTTRVQSAPSGAPEYDDYQEAVADTYTTSATGVPCFARRRTGTGEVDEPGRSLVTSGWQVRFAKGLSIGPDDQIADVRDEAGALLVAGPLGITDLMLRAGHKLAVCTAATLAGPLEIEEDE